MNDPMIQPATSTDTLSGIRIEESLNSQFNSLESRAPDRKVDQTHHELYLKDHCRRDLLRDGVGDDDLELAELNTITSESSGVVSGLTSSQASGSTSAATLPSPREEMGEMDDLPHRSYDRLKSAMVSL